MNNEKKKKKKKKKNHFNPNGIRTHNRPDKRQVIYLLHYKYRLVITDRTFHLNYNNYNKITVCFYKTLRFTVALLFTEYYVARGILKLLCKTWEFPATSYSVNSQGIIKIALLFVCLISVLRPFDTF